MGISTSCSLMVGLPYKELKALVNGFDEDVYDIDIDEMINNGDLETGSIYYDSDRSENIVGRHLKYCNGFVELEDTCLIDGSEGIVAELEGMLPTIDWKLYLTLDIT